MKAATTRRARRIFTSYSHRDEAHKAEMEKHLAPLLLQGRVQMWSDRHVRAGGALYELIDDGIRAADIILLLISADYLSSESCQVEMAAAIERSARREALAIPIVVRACDWMALPIGQLLSANRDGRPISSASDVDVAWFEVVGAIKQILNDWDAGASGESAGDQAAAGSDAVADEQAIAARTDGGSSERWVYRKDANDEAWENVKLALEHGLAREAELDQSAHLQLETRRWGEKIIVDVRSPRRRGVRRLLIADIGGYAGYPGYQLEVYPRDGSSKLPYERLRWIEGTDGTRLLARLEPQPDERFTPAAYAERLWEALRASG